MFWELSRFRFGIIKGWSWVVQFSMKMSKLGLVCDFKVRFGIAQLELRIVGVGNRQDVGLGLPKFS